ncbi:MAG: HAMP domain-containing sensor histidine kinase [Bacillota bacterium]|nr:HAMP domain-containing sensor histidine kinase [Bacillota bacterium]
MIRFRSIRLSFIIYMFFLLILSGIISYSAFIVINHFFEITKNLPIVVLLTTLTSAVLVGILSIVFSYTLTDSIRKISKATKEVSTGNFDIRIPVNTKSIIYQNDMEELIIDFNKMVDELSSIQILRDDFINEFSHEFKTPINSIVGYAKQLQYNTLSDEERDMYISIIISESKRLSDLSSSILQLKNLETQNIISNKKTFFLDEQIREVILLMQNDWEQKDLDLELDLEEISYFSNEDLLKQVWINVINNAIKFSNPHSKLTITCQEKEEIVVSIQDEGVGMSAEVQAHMFDKFYQGDTSRSTQGNGLGLSLVKRIVDLLEGKIEVESEEGKGSLVRIRLKK